MTAHSGSNCGVRRTRDSGGHTTINLVLAGDDGRFAVEDDLAAGAVANAIQP